ncbi:MAG TPA: ribbon-helix-helix protein, CopG family [Tahibacter sp.]|nr:ribbon-helix-helix protein, CopG family [Tahibacter sp.]
MPRTIIDIPDAQLREVDRLCERLNISRAEAVRRGLRVLVEQHSDVATHGFGLWKDAALQRTELVPGTRSRR